MVSLDQFLLLPEPEPRAFINSKNHNAKAYYKKNKTALKNYSKNFQKSHTRNYDKYRASAKQAYNAKSLKEMIQKLNNQDFKRLPLEKMKKNNIIFDPIKKLYYQS